MCTERQVLVLTSPADEIENCCPTYECICEAIVECEVCPEGQGSMNRPDRKKLSRKMASPWISFKVKYLLQPEIIVKMVVVQLLIATNLVSIFWV